VSLAIGVAWGATAGSAGGLVDEAMMRVVDVLDSIPLVFLVVFLVTVLGEDSVRLALDRIGIGRLAIFYVVVAAVSWLSMARIVRAKVLELRGATMIEAARAIGASPARIVRRHLLPNLIGVVIVTLSLTVPRVMLFESFLSFLGLGVQPPDVSWGLLANAGFRALVPFDPAWWLFVFPSAALASTLLALGFLGDALGARSA
jgi:oligopeptide transport system permease protein